MEVRLINTELNSFDLSKHITLLERLQEELKAKGRGLKGFFADEETTKQPYLERRRALLEIVRWCLERVEKYARHLGVAAKVPHKRP